MFRKLCFLKSGCLRQGSPFPPTNLNTMRMNRTLLVFVLFLTAGAGYAQDLNQLLLKDYRPVSIYKVPVSKILKAKFQVVDMHSHAYAQTEEELSGWVKRMDTMGISKTIILSFATGHKFDSIHARYAAYGNRFEIWCGFDYTGCDKPGWSTRAVKELERCYKVGARGVGELGDKGIGELYSTPVPGYGVHIDDPRMKPLLERCGQLKMPISIHVAEPIWMYEKMDSTNDGLFNAFLWKIDKSQPGLLGHRELVQTLENAVKQNPGTTFIACHFANCEYDLSIVGTLLSKYKNLYADIAARYGETASIPRYMQAFYEKHQDKLLYGTDMGTELIMYRATFRILETNDEHFYEHDYFHYHWPLSGFGLRDAVLKKIYYENANKIIQR
jgi:uncharacterized protein